MRLIPGLLLVAALACSPPDPPADTGPAAAADSGESPADTAASPDSTADDEAQDARSRYTSLRDCAVVDSQFPHWMVRSCPGIGVTLKHTEGDGRDELIIVRESGEEHPLTLRTFTNGAFTLLGPRAEWRQAVGAAPDDPPAALIFRFGIYREPDRPVSYLVVARLEEACVVGLVDPGPGQNERARELADSNAPCVEPPPS